MQVNFQPSKPTLLRPKFGAFAMTAQNPNELVDAFRNKQAMFWDVDTQRGFMWPNVLKKVGDAVRRVGLQVTGAEAIVSNLKKLTELAQKFLVPLVSTLDTHDKNDPEFQLFTAFSDEHCVKGAEDWPKIPETTPQGTPRQIDVNPKIKDVPSVDELREIFARGQSVALEKNTISAFQRRVGKTLDHMVKNQKAVELVNNLKQLGIRFAFVYGVATDYCVQAAVSGMKKLGITPIVVKDAIKEINTAANPLHDAACDDYKDVITVTTEDVAQMLQEANDNSPQPEAKRA